MADVLAEGHYQRRRATRLAYSNELEDKNGAWPWPICVGGTVDGRKRQRPTRPVKGWLHERSA